jgi:hypothetical protein
VEAGRLHRRGVGGVIFDSVRSIPCRIRAPWDQQRHESTKAFHAFVLFRDGGWDRSIQKVVTQLTKSRALLSRRSREYQWKERAQAWDEFQDQLSQHQMVNQRLQMNKTTLEKNLIPVKEPRSSERGPLPIRQRKPYRDHTHTLVSTPITFCENSTYDLHV